MDNTEYRGPNDNYTVVWVPSIGYIQNLKIIVISCYMPVRELRSTSFSVIPVTSSSFPSPLRPSRHVSVLPVTSPSPSSLCFTYRSLSSSIVSPSFVFRLFLCYGSSPPLLCSEHHFSDLWLRYHTLTSSHSCGWTISLLSS